MSRRSGYGSWSGREGDREQTQERDAGEGEDRQTRTARRQSAGRKEARKPHKDLHKDLAFLVLEAGCLV